MSDFLNYEQGLLAISNCVSESILLGNQACLLDDKKYAHADGSAILKQELSDCVNTNIEPVFGKNSELERLRDAVLRPLAIFHTHALAQHAAMSVYRSNGTNDWRQQESIIGFELNQLGRSAHDEAAAAVCRWMEHEAQERFCAQVFLGFVNQHIKDSKKVYYPHGPASCHWYGPMGGCFISEHKPGKISFSFTYWDGADAITLALGRLFSERDDRRLLEHWATRAFTHSVTFAAGHSTILAP